MDRSELIGSLKNTFIIPESKKNVGRNERIISTFVGMFLGVYASQRKTAFPLLLPAGYLLYRGLTGYCYLNELTGRNTREGAAPFSFSRTIFINSKRSEVFEYWRNLENLPNIMKHIHKVQKISDNQYHWEAKFTDKIVKWNAQITEEIPDQKISWQSLESADISNSGTVEFNESQGGTELTVTINYLPSETESGKIIASLLNPLFKKAVKNDLREFKRKMERGEMPFTKPFVSV